MKVVSLFLLLLLFASTALAFIFDVENEKVSIWKGEIDTSWYNDSQTEFTITTAEQLAGLAKLVNEGYDFKGITVNLGANINLKKKDWTPIGAEFLEPFKGTFDGKGFVVSGLYIDADVARHGLFGENSGMIRNLGIIDSYVSGGWAIGGLAGINNDIGVIDNCYFFGTAKVERKYVGGLVGANSGIIINSYSTGKVEIGNSSAPKDQSNAGGLAGTNGSGSRIINSYSTSTVVGSYSVGGLVGDNDGRIINSYSIGAVEGNYYVGGLVGFNNKGSIINSYSIGTVKGREDVGGFVGGNNVKINAYIVNVYYDESMTNQSMKQKSTYIGWDFDKTWGIDGKVNGGYPYLQKYDYGIEYIISTAKELTDFEEAVNGGDDFLFKTVKLGADIMLNDTADWQKWEYKTPKNKWWPIGTGYYPFNGTFDGNGFVISGVYVNFYKDKHGLFQHIGSAGIIKNLGVVASHIEGEHNIGGFAGINEGEISNCYYIGNVLGYGGIGGLVGDNMGIIKKSYSIGSSVSQSGIGDNVGGLVGRNYKGVISDSYSHSTATGRYYVGGLAGYGSSGIIKNSYSTGAVRGTEHIGGFIGGSGSNNKNNNNYYDIQTSGQKDKDKSGGKTTAEMKKKETFAGWDFDRTWRIDGKVNGGYPYLLKAK